MSIENSEVINFEQPFKLGQWLITPALNTISLHNDQTATYDKNLSEQQPITRKLTPKVMALCVYLAKNNGHPVSQNDIADIIWPDRIISDSSIYQAIAQLRKALNLHEEEINYIERVSGKGYRLLVKAMQSIEKDTLQPKIKDAELLTAASARSTKLTMSRWSIQFFSLLLILPVLVGILFYFFEPEEVASETITIAVLPTINLTQPSIEPLNGFNQLLLSDLLSLPELKFIYLREKTDDISTMLRLSTTVQQHQGSLLVSVQLINQDDNQVLWAKNLEANKSELLLLKNAVVTALVDYLLPGQVAFSNQFNDKMDSNYENYALARYLWDKRDPSSLNKAQILFKQILVQSPEHLGALIGLCHTYIYLSIYGEWSPSQAHTKCQPLVEKALANNLNNGEVMATQALLLMQQGKTIAAEKLIKKAVKAAPNYAMGHHWHANLLRRTGMYQQALQADKIAFSLDPLSPIIIRGLAYSYLNMRQVKEARKYYQRALTIEPHYSLRAVEELDFLPLNKARAQAFIQWLNSEPANIANIPVYKITQAIVWLGLGKPSKAQSLIASISKQEVNPGYLLYAQSAIASAKGDLKRVLEKLTMRLELAPNITRYAMPYIAALKHNKLPNKALLKFRHYFPEITLSSTITNENVAQFIFFGTLLDDNKQSKLTKQVITKINNYLTQKNIQLNDRDNVYWYALIEQHVQVKQAIESLLDKGWLPDYNDNIFSEDNLKIMYLKSGGSTYQWHHLLQKNRSIE